MLVWQLLHGITFSMGYSMSLLMAVIGTAAGNTSAVVLHAKACGGHRFRDGAHYHIRGHWLLPGPSSLTGGLGVGFPLDPLNHGRRLDASAGLGELVGEFLMPRTTPARLPAHVLTP